MKLLSYETIYDAVRKTQIGPINPIYLINKQSEDIWLTKYKEMLYPDIPDTIPYQGTPLQGIYVYPNDLIPHNEFWIVGLYETVILKLYETK